MKNSVSIVLFLVLLCNSAVLLAQTQPEQIKTESEKYQDYFYESLLQKGIGNNDKAIAALEQCLKFKPNDATTYFEIGKNQLARKEYENAYSSFEKATQIDPKNKWFWIGMYDVSYQSKDYKKAILTVTKLIEFDELYKEDLTSLYMKTQQFDKALLLINELNDKVGKSETRELYKAQILSQGNFQEAEIVNLKEQISKNPKLESNYIALIRLYSENDDPKNALDITRKLEAEIPTSEWAQVGLFKYYLENNQAEKAVISMNVVLASSKMDDKIRHRILNEFLIYVDSHPQFATDLEKAISYFDKDQNVDVAKEIGKYYHNKKQWQKAATYYERALKNNSVEDVETDLLLFDVYVETKQFGLMEKKASLLIESFPTQPQFYYFAGLANNQLLQFKKAKEFLEMGLDYLVDNVLLEINYNIQLGEAFNGLGNVQKKEFYFSKANQLIKDKK
jgi:tetratricopeptide (TPR) repeat protein